MEIIFSSRNPGKIEQVKALFQSTPIKILSLDDAGIEGEGVEDGTTIEENSFKKAKFAWDKSHSWVMADDTGFFIDALNGEPGVHAAIWAGKDAPTIDHMNLALEKLKGIPKEKRGANFRAVVTVFSPEGVPSVFDGEARGVILEAPTMQPQPRMPYSSIFIYEGSDVSFIELPIEKQNEVSHRGKVFRKVRDFLISEL